MSEHPVIREARLNIDRAGLSLQRASEDLQRRMDVPVVQANPVELAKVQAATTLDVRKDIEALERFTGVCGELCHFIKGGDRVSRRISAKKQEGRLTGDDEVSLRAALVCRVSRGILNRIQADEETPWESVRDRLRKEFGDGRWSPEEDVLTLFRTRRGAQQSKGDYAAALMTQFSAVSSKVRETLEPEAAEAKLGLWEAILRVQLGLETGKPRNRPFQEAAQELVDALGRGEEDPETDPHGWRRVSTRRREPQPRPRVEERRTPERREARREAAPRPSPRRSEPRGRGERPPRREQDRRCHGCGRTGHIVARCPRTKCFECNSGGHIARDCPYVRRRPVDRGEPMDCSAQTVRRGPRRTYAQVARRDVATTEDSDYSSSEAPERSPARPSSRSSAGSLRHPVPVPKKRTLVSRV